MTLRTGPRVHKFGGTSVADADRLRRAARLASSDGEATVVVVSALAGVTNELLALGDTTPERAGEGVRALLARHRDALNELSPPDPTPLEVALTAVANTLTGALAGPPGPQRSDRILACGEDFCVPLMVAALRSEGAPAEAVDAREVVRTDDRFGAAVPQHDRLAGAVRAVIAPRVASGTTCVVQGFVGADPQGRTTTLGRGGSDHTAVLVGAALDAVEVVVWTDVPGMHTADPNEVDDVRVIPELGFEEAVELAYFGARVLQPAAAKHAVAERVPLRIRDSRHPEGPGTVVRHDRRGAADFAAVAYKPDVVLIEVRAFPSALEHGFLARVFGVLANHRVAIDLVATSHSSTAFTIDRAEELEAVREELTRFADVRITGDVATVTVVGRGLLARPGMDAQTFWAIGDTPVHLISQASDVSLSFVVDTKHAQTLIRRLHAALIDARPGGSMEIA